MCKMVFNIVHDLNIGPLRCTRLCILASSSHVLPTEEDYGSSVSFSVSKLTCWLDVDSFVLVAYLKEAYRTLDLVVHLLDFRISQLQVIALHGMFGCYWHPVLADCTPFQHRIHNTCTDTCKYYLHASSCFFADRSVQAGSRHDRQAS